MARVLPTDSRGFLKPRRGKGSLRGSPVFPVAHKFKVSGGLFGRDRTYYVPDTSRVTK